jgi:PTS system mannose-specific IIA component
MCLLFTGILTGKEGKMTGIIVVAHFNLAREMVAATELIVGKQKQFEYVDIFPDGDVDKIKNKIIHALKVVDTGEGILILTDMFGGTPSNISLSFLEEGRVEVVTGVNLPMLIKLVTYREGKSLDELAHFITQYGQKNIYLATDVLRARKKE